jgi:tyrosinase
VYVNVPAGQPEASYPARRAGRVSLFGTTTARRQALGHGRDGFNFVLDVTNIYRALSASGEWDPAHLRVTLKPVYDWSDEVTVGRVSVNAS